jgi:hypothetical protein
MVNGLNVGFVVAEALDMMLDGGWCGVGDGFVRNDEKDHKIRRAI